MKKPVIFYLLCCLAWSALAQQPTRIENLIIITLDGLRWQEVFYGVDTAIAADPAFNHGEQKKIIDSYWAEDIQERRRRLMPFLWTVVASKGQIYGNRRYDNRVDNANPYWFSYPGYSEIFCGYVDSAINTNSYPPNPNVTLLEYIHQQPAFRGKVAAFCAWDAFDRILNEVRSGVWVVAGADPCGGTKPTPREQIINDMKRDCFSPFGQEEQLDVFTHHAAFEYLKNKKPRVLYIGYGETDEWGHAGRYRYYLDAACQTDRWIRDLWLWVQSHPQYRDKTGLFITVDHGRGDAVKAEWTSHGQRVPDSHETWFALMGPGVPPAGERKTPVQVYQTQYAQTLARWLGINYRPKHPVGEDLWPIILEK